MKSLLFGGAFNPLTNAHLLLADEALRKTDSNEVIFLPSKSDYVLNEERKGFCFSDEERLKILQEVAKRHNWMSVSDYELNLSEQPRTYFSLKHFKSLGKEVRLLIGSDWLIDMKKRWKYVDEIAKEFGIVVVERNEDEAETIIRSDPSLIELLPYFLIIKPTAKYRSISSSKVRELLQDWGRNKMQIKELVPPEEYDELKEIYGK